MASTPVEDKEKERAKPNTKGKSQLDKELQAWEVESTMGGQDSQGNG
jgi:hypothetical protein